MRVLPLAVSRRNARDIDIVFRTITEPRSKSRKKMGRRRKNCGRPEPIERRPEMRSPHWDIGSPEHPCAPCRSAAPILTPSEPGDRMGRLLEGSLAVRARWAWLVATAGGVGAVPWAPGTAGSVVGLAAGAAAARVLNPWWYLGLVGALFALGVAASGRAEREARRRDPSFIVIDEVVGMLVALFALPARTGVF